MATSFQKQLQDMQLKISQYAVDEAKAKKEKAEVELETAKLNQECLRAAMERDGILVPRKVKGGYGS